MPRHWLLKTEPGCFSIDDLAAAPGQTTAWDGVRNYQARNFLREMAVGDLALFYHSVVNPSAVGVAEIVREAYPDPTALDPDDRHFDPRATPEDPVWFMVDVRLAARFAAPVTLAAMRREPELAGMELLRKGSRLSVMPVSAEEFALVRRLGGLGPQKA
ncbi:EVE domain-containing protein [Solidesulfovibrio sp.]|uniref:EVE domain-containing protein n=1 Tax=Solidesulfovibrio sp. TaxID=2910990 RepID=UPI002601B51C|nr:EVE domain-containing protein [Solidesulfovibrio sp.]